MSLGIKKGDKVVVLAGKDKGKTSKVLKVFKDKNRVIVEGINLAKKHTKRRSENEPGGIIEVPLPVHISNVALYCSRCNRATRFRTKILEDKSKIRICVKCNQPI